MSEGRCVATNCHIVNDWNTKYSVAFHVAKIYTHTALPGMKIQRPKFTAGGHDRDLSITLFEVEPTLQKGSTKSIPKERLRSLSRERLFDD